MIGPTQGRQAPSGHQRGSSPAGPALHKARAISAQYRGDDRQAYRGDDRGASGWRDDGRGAGPDHAFYRGGRLPPEYRGRQYVVDDWRGHRLNAPPRGYHWVQAGGDYVLVAIATGIIASILLNQ